MITETVPVHGNTIMITNAVSVNGNNAVITVTVNGTSTGDKCVPECTL